MSRHSLLRQLVVIVIVAALPAFAAHMAVQIGSDLRMARTHTGADARDLAAALSPVLKGALIVNDLATVQEALDDVASGGQFRRLQVTNAGAGRPIVSGRNGPAREAERIPDWFESLLDIRLPEEHFPIEAGGRVYGILLVEPAPTFLIVDIWERLWTAAAIWLVTITLFLILVRFALRRGLRPLDELAQAAHRFGAGDLDCRAPVAMDPELAETALAFNQMAERLAAARRQADEFQASLERRVQERTSELERVNAELEQFAYVASHDLREPLRTVSSYLGLIERRMGDAIQPDLREFLDFAIDGSKRMDALIRDLLQYSRTGRNDQPVEEVELGRLVELALANLNAAMEGCGADVGVTSGMPVVLVHQGDVVRLFQNLIGNAMKYRHADRPPRIRVSCHVVDGFAELAIEDNGIGFPMDQAERVFGIFQRLHSDREYEGTGIGLAVCHKIVTAHGGRIWAEGEPGQGSVFRFTLPLA